ncbi:polyisoprenoid-binding protein, partial [Xanthomonas sp. Kuri4-2]
MKTTQKLLLPLALTLAIAACSKPAEDNTGTPAPAAEPAAATAPA